jgi:hypothetical protein
MRGTAYVLSTVLNVESAPRYNLSRVGCRRRSMSKSWGSSNASAAGLTSQLVDRVPGTGDLLAIELVWTPTPQ